MITIKTTINLTPKVGAPSSAFLFAAPWVADFVRGSALRSRSVGDWFHAGTVLEGALDALPSLVGNFRARHVG